VVDWKIALFRDTRYAARKARKRKGRSDHQSINR
jgi:hypothetical protein